MNLINCLDCGKLIIPNDREELCVECNLVQKDRENTIKSYVYRNPRATRIEVYMETGISLHIIDRINNT